MATFTDELNRGWEIKLAANQVHDVRQTCDPLFLVNEATPESNTFARLNADPLLLCQVVLALTAKQRQERGVDDDSFYEGLVGNAIDSASQALRVAIVEFSPRHVRELIDAYLQQEALQRQATQKALKKMNDPALVAELMDRFEGELEAVVTSLRGLSPADSDG